MHCTQRLLAIAAVVAGLFPLSPALAAAPEPVIANSDLNTPLMYQILLAEISANNGDDANAFSLTLDAARKANSVQLFERAVELGLRARSADFALEAARAWQRSFPASKEANRYILQILIGTNKLTEIAEPLKRDLQGLSGKDRIAAINLIPRYFPRVTDRTLAASIVEQALAADLTTSNYGPAAWTAVGSMRLAAGNAAGALDAAQRGAALDAGADEPAVLALNLMEAKTPAAESIVLKYLSGNALPDVRMAYGRALIGSQRYAEALAQMKTLNQQKPDFPDAWLVRGSLELQDRGNTASEKSLKKYLSLLPAEQNSSDESETGRGAVQAYLLLAQIAEQDGKPDEANAYLQRIKSPQDALRVTTRRAMLLARQGKLDEARAAIRSAPELQADARAPNWQLKFNCCGITSSSAKPMPCWAKPSSLIRWIPPLPTTKPLLPKSSAGWMTWKGYCANSSARRRTTTMPTTPWVTHWPIAMYACLRRANLSKRHWNLRLPIRSS